MSQLRADMEANSDEPKENGSGAGASQWIAGLLLAEWVSFGVSLALVGGLAGYLVYQSTLPETPYVAAFAEPRWQEIHQENGRYILPVEIRNGGRRTLRNLKVELSYTPDGSLPESRELEIDYLGEGSSTTEYVYFQELPSSLNLKVRPLQYRLD